MGGGMMQGYVTFAHFAPNVLSADNTAVTIYVNGEPTDPMISYGESTGRLAFEPDGYKFGFGTPEAELFTLDQLTVEAGNDFMIAAYFDSLQTTPINAFVYNLTTQNLDPSNGRVVFGHGADDPMLTPLDVVNVDRCPPPVFANVEFGMSREQDWVAMAGPYVLGLVLQVEQDECTPEVLFSVTIAAEVTTVLVAVDEDPSDERISVQVWEVVDAGTPVAL